MTVDFDKIMKEVVDRGRVALEATATYALERAKEHAPVRSIFDDTQNPRGAAFPKSFKTIRSQKRYDAFLASKRRSRNIDSAGPLGRKIQGDSIGSGSTLSERRGSRGHSNSLFPVLRAGNERVVGDFRSLGGTPDVVRKRPGTRSRVVRSESVSHAIANRPSSIRGNPIERLRQSSLTSRGRFEVKEAFAGRERKGRTSGGKQFALSAAFGVTEASSGRVGGRLRGELRKSQQVWRGNVLWQYIESPTPYGVHQEFGTTRHRPQPFLRPALYESRQRLRSEVRKIDREMRGNVRMARQARNLESTDNPLTGG